MAFKFQPHKIHSAVWLHRLRKFNCLCHVERRAGNQNQINLCLNLVENINCNSVHSDNLTKWLLFLRKWCKQTTKTKGRRIVASEKIHNKHSDLDPNHQVRRQECPTSWRTKWISVMKWKTITLEKGVKEVIYHESKLSIEARE